MIGTHHQALFLLVEMRSCKFFAWAGVGWNCDSPNLCLLSS
jgi:hypothetical protein